MHNETTASWLQLSLEAIHHTPDQLEDALLEGGAVAVILQDAGEDPVLEPEPGKAPLWPRTRVTGLFDAQTDIEVLKRILCHALASEILPECRLEQLEERDWVRAWMDDFHPMRFGKHLWVCPSQQAPPDPSAINLFLDPGLAFGTGTHPTTALCLKWLDGARLTAQTVIDYGCGSGILAIAAAKLGATKVWAVDIDPQALIASDQNAASNGVADKVVLGAPADLPSTPMQVLIANILAGTLIGLAAHFSTLVAKGGQLVLSGILEHQADAVQTAFAPWFDFGARRRQEDWVLLQARRKD